MSAPSGVKLRDSCESCAASKVKCSKDKPTCARCAERGTTCQYLVTQRTGRKARGRSKGHATSSKGTTAPLPTYPSFSQPETLSPADSFLDLPFTVPDPRLDNFMLASCPPSPPFSRPVTSSSTENTCTFQSQCDGSSVFAEYTGNREDHADVHVPVQLWENPLSTSSTETVFDRYEHYGLADLAGTRSSFPTTLQLSQLSDTTTMQSSQPDSDCVEAALRLMSQLSCPREFPLQCASLSPTTTTGHGHERQASGLLPTLQTVIDGNKEVIEAIGTMLQLPCSQDGYFIILVSLVVSRILSRYAAVARGSSSSTPETNSEPSSSTSSASSSLHRPSISSGPVRVPSGTPLKREEIDPKTAQQVLNELYQVQVLIDKLASRMQICEKRNRTFGGEVFPLDTNSNDAASLTAFPFSATVLNQLDIELRKRLRTLSLELIDGLRQYWA